MEKKGVKSDDLCSYSSVVAKGKRTKRRRIHRVGSSIAVAGSSTSSVEFSGMTTEEEEEEDMANCLILLAQGRWDTNGGKAAEKGLYRCRTCDKCFSSFQALGGHRTSHKRVKIAPAEVVDGEEEKNLKISLSSIADKSVGNDVKVARVHECLICGAEFSSGQALGGHMRRHRQAPIPVPLMDEKEKKLFSLDLNLPAPADDEFAFSGLTELPLLSMQS